MPMNNKPISNVITDMTRSAVPGSVKNINAADTTVIIMAIRNQACPASGFMSLYQMTGYFTAPVGFFKWRHNSFTHLTNKSWAAGVECAARWQSQQAGHICAA